MSMTKRYAESIGAFNVPADDSQQWAAYCEWSETLGGQDFQYVDCISCFREDGNVHTGLCDECWQEMADAIERDAVEEVVS